MATWEDAMNKSVKESLGEIDSLDQDVTARFKGVAALVESLSSQVSDLDAHTEAAPVSRVDFARATGWNTNQGWGSKVQVSVPVPAYKCYANIQASGQAYMLSGKAAGGNGADQVFMGASRITIQGAPNSPEVYGTLIGPDGTEHWGLAMTHSAGMFLNGGGSILITYDVYNANNYTADQRDASLGVISTFTRAM